MYQRVILSQHSAAIISLGRYIYCNSPLEGLFAMNNPLVRGTQGWAIVVGSWKDILSDYVGQDFSSDQAATFGE